jgi:rfaE bifunctional protein nucleotidyltransferase chain/domain
MGKVQKFEDIRKAIDAARKKGKKIVATNGCFDIIHVGHVRNLQAAKKLGDILVVGINSDASVRTNKDHTRPIVPARERAEVIAALDPVDYVFIFSGRTPFSWIKKLKPHIHVKGGGKDILSHPDLAAQRAAIEEGGGKFVLLPHHSGRSTSALIRKIIQGS